MIESNAFVSIVEATETEAEWIRKKLADFNRLNLPQIDFGEKKPVQFLAVDEKKRFMGGLIGEIYPWGALAIQSLWVEPSDRTRGIGKKLLEKAEEKALQSGCTIVRLETFDFQAKDFYLKNNYIIFGQIDDCPPGHTEYYLYKRLQKR